jgi:hypothetical protein
VRPSPPSAVANAARNAWEPAVQLAGVLSEANASALPSPISFAFRAIFRRSSQIRVIVLFRDAQGKRSRDDEPRRCQCQYERGQLVAQVTTSAHHAAHQFVMTCMCRPSLAAHHHSAHPQISIQFLPRSLLRLRSSLDSCPGPAFNYRTSSISVSKHGIFNRFSLTVFLSRQSKNV